MKAPDRPCLLIACLLLAVAASLPAQNTVPLYGLHIIPTRAKTVVTINDFPFAQTSHLENTSSSGRVNRFLKRGENVIRIEIDDTVISAPENDNAAAQHLRIELQRRDNLDEKTPSETLFGVERQVDLGDKAGDRTMEFLTVSTSAGDREYRGPLTGRSVLRVDLESSGIDFSMVEPPASSVVEIRFRLPDFPLLALPWQEGAATPDEAALGAIQARVVAMRDAYQAKDANLVVSHFQHKLGRMAIAQGIPAAQLGGFLHDSYMQVLFTIAGLEFAALEPGSIQVETYPGLNLARAIAAGGAPIRASGEGWEFNLNLYFSRIEGTWQLVE